MDGEGTKALATQVRRAAHFFHLRMRATKPTLQPGSIRLAAVGVQLLSYNWRATTALAGPVVQSRRCDSDHGV